MIKDPIRKIGIYFKPLLTLPFSTIETINEEKKEIIVIAATEKYLKLTGSTAISLNFMGKDVPVLGDATANFETKFNMTNKR